jgi:prepilin-type N-terminal cleavage/methylation domain-containing protein
MRTRTNNRGFTLIEILIVVVILGILAAIVIPQFTSASQDAQDSQVRSQLQTVRGQIELYNVQTGEYPASVVAGGADPWGDMVTGRYLQQDPRNSMRDNAVGIVTGTAAPGAAGVAADGDGNGWYWNTTTQILYAIDRNNAILDF